MSETDIYKLVLSGKLKRFPPGFWEGEDAYVYSPKLVRYMIEEVLNWKKEDIPIKIRRKTFYEHKLATMFSVIYNSSPYSAITSAYPEQNYKPWDFISTPNKYWRGDEGLVNAINATKWLMEDELKWSKSDVISKLNQDVFAKHNLLGMIKRGFNNSIFEAIDKTYPGEYKAWEIGGHIRNEYWNLERGKLAVKWLFEEKLCWSIDDIKKKHSKQIYIDNNLYGMLQSCFNSSPNQAILSIYHDLIHEWELPVVSQNFWTFDNALKATKWMIEEKLMWTPEEAKDRCTKNTFIDYNLISIFDKFKIHEILNELYPNKKEP